MEIPAQQISSLEVARGEKSNAARGAFIGGFYGGFGLGMIAAIGALSEEGWFAPPSGTVFVVGFIVGSLVGSATGAIIGSGSTSVRWARLSLEEISVKEKGLVTPISGEDSGIKIAEDKSAVGRIRRLRFSLTCGPTTSGPADDIEKAMIRYGLNRTSAGGWFGSGPVRHPFSITGFGEIGVPYTAQLTYSLNQHFECGIILSHAGFGETFGYDDTDFNLRLKYYTTIISPLLMYKMMGTLQIGLGPGLYINKIGKEEKKQLGGLYQATLIYPKRTRFFVKLDAQYRLIPKTTYGPFIKLSGGTHKGLGPFEANFSHLFAGFGFGIHF